MHLFRSPPNSYGALGGCGLGFGSGDDLDMDDSSTDIVDSIDVRQILGLNEDFLPT